MTIDQNKLNRHTAIKAGAGCALAGVAVRSSDPVNAGEPNSRIQTNVYEQLGVKPVINAAGTLTALGGSLMPPEVVEAWAHAARNFVDLSEPQDRVGERIAQRLGVEGALVTTGAAGALLLGTAAAITGGTPEFVRRLPDTSGMKNEVITQKTHHTCYDHQITACGVKLVDIETRAELESAIGPHTAMMLFYNLFDPDGHIQRTEWVEVARRAKIPTLLDAAADVPPRQALHRYNEMGFDMVAFSGGKALLGPNDTGLRLGSTALIEAAKANTAPRCGNIGRNMKVSKEDMVAMWAAIERYYQVDHKAEWHEWERRLGSIEAALRAIPTLKTERTVPPIANHVPHVLLSWDVNRVRITREQVTQQLLAGDPPIALGRVRGTGDEGLLVSVFMLKPGEEEIVAQRLRGVFLEASV